MKDSNRRDAIVMHSTLEKWTQMDVREEILYKYLYLLTCPYLITRQAL